MNTRRDEMAAWSGWERRHTELGWRSRPLGTERRRWKASITMNLRELGYEYGRWMEMAYIPVQRSVLKLRTPSTQRAKVARDRPDLRNETQVTVRQGIESLSSCRLSPHTGLWYALLAQCGICGRRREKENFSRGTSVRPVAQPTDIYKANTEWRKATVVNVVSLPLRSMIH
jgi:hypothetical protein